MNDLSEIDSLLYKNIVAVVEEGNIQHESGAYEAALERYSESWHMLPEPKEQWDLSHWIAKCYSSLYLALGAYGEAKIWAIRAVQTKPPRETSSFIFLGASYLGLDEKESAYEFFKKAFEIGKKRAFQGFDGKYFGFLNGYKDKNE
ncbi:hypothetical protein TZ03_25205 [Pseudomonas sp. 10-1B]|uniref:hypothetical protein n=1 Tax=Pseudomonas sp. 10-1B TaxID=1546029 RepID=UPI00061EA40E|nr:hypothetical protein [Pseudomonas sp. 10-1B]KIY37962.1 hypothetical protein TZ03_25205 [Pseudomonas sp. 10-1B]